MSETNRPPDTPADPKPATPTPATDKPKEISKEIGGRKSGLDPTRYGDWEKNGRCIDF